MSGLGEILIGEGKYYIGSHFNNVMEGFGIYLDVNHSTAFVGYWKDGKKKGVGVVITKNETRKYCLFDKNALQKVFSSVTSLQNFINKNPMNKSLMKINYKDCLKFYENYIDYFKQERKVKV